MTIAEFMAVQAHEAAVLLQYTGARMEVIGVYADAGTWIAHVEHLCGNGLIIEQCRWYADYAKSDWFNGRVGAWRWLGENGRPCDRQGREEEAAGDESR